MLSRLHHQFNLAVPLIGVCAVVTLMLTFGSVVAELVRVPQVPSVQSVATIGSGIDAFAAIGEPWVRIADAWTKIHALWIALVALVATALLSVCTVCRKGHRIATAAFWVGTLTVPVAFLAIPDHFKLPLAVLFGLSAIAHIL